jgi:hypothetical protein
VREECTSRLAEIDALVPAIVFDVKDERGAPVSSVRMSIDGAAPVTLDGGSVEFDPGEHLLRFEAPTMATVELRITARVGEKDRHEGVIFAPAMRPEPSRPPAAPPGSLKPFAIVAGAVGLSALATGVGFGLAARSSWSDSQDACASSSHCTDRHAAVHDRSGALSEASISTVAFAVGAGALVAAVVLWVVSPPSSRTVRTGMTF